MPAADYTKIAGEIEKAQQLDELVTRTNITEAQLKYWWTMNKKQVVDTPTKSTKSRGSTKGDKCSGSLQSLGYFTVNSNLTS